MCELKFYWVASCVWNFHNVTHVKNTFGKLLDLVFCDFIILAKVVGSSQQLSGVDSYHPPLEISFEVDELQVLQNRVNVTVYQFDKADYAALNIFFGNADWAALMQCCSVDMMVICFYKILFLGIDMLVPKKLITHDKFPNWYTPELRRLIRHKNKLYNKYRRMGFQEDYDMYSEVRKASQSTS